MYILPAEDVDRDVSQLDAAWARPETFAFAPGKSGVPEAWLSEALRALPPACAEGHFVLLTSGSTGLPKLIVGARERAERLARLLHELQGNEAAAQTTLLLPLAYSFAFVNQWVWSRVTGRRLVVTRGFAEPRLLRDALAQGERAMICMVGGQVPLLRPHLGDEAFPGVVRLHFAGGPFPQARLDELRRTFPNAQVYNNYGCAEAMPRLTLRRAEDGAVGHDIGRPLPGIELRADEAGALVFRSPFSAVGWIDAEGFHPVAPDAWIPSGDLGVVHPDGHVELLGRSNEVFKRYGEKISLPALRHTVLEAWHGDATFYKERDRSGEEGHVLVLAPHPTDAAQVRALLAAFRKTHRRPHWPLRVESVDRLPLLPNGKVDARAVASVEGRIIHWDQRT